MSHRHTSFLGNTIAISAELNNRQLHQEEIKWIEENADGFAKKLYGNNPTNEQIADAKARLAQQSLRQVDKAWSYALGSQTDEAAKAFLQTNNAQLFVVKDATEFRDGSITRYKDTTTEISSLDIKDYTNLKNFYSLNVYAPTSTNPDGSLRPINEAFSNETGEKIDALTNIDSQTLNQAIRDFFPNMIEGITGIPNTVKNTGNYIDAIAPTTNAQRMDELYNQGNAGSTLQANLATTDTISTLGMATGVGALTKIGLDSAGKAINDSLDIKMESVSGKGEAGDALTSTPSRYTTDITPKMQDNIDITLNYIATGATKQDVSKSLKQNWGEPFKNSKGDLPDLGVNGYKEYRVSQPDTGGGNVHRVVVGKDGNYYYTDTHYGDNPGQPYHYGGKFTSDQTKQIFGN